MRLAALLVAVASLPLEWSCQGGLPSGRDGGPSGDGETWALETGTERDTNGTGDNGSSADVNRFLPGPPCTAVPGPRTPLELPVTAGSAIAYQIDVAHTGNQPVSALQPPLTRRWAVDLGGSLSYPLIVGGRVFTTAADPGTGGSNVIALSLETGEILWGPTAVRGHYFWSTVAYEDKRVFVLGDDGYLAALDEATGATLWINDLHSAINYMMSSPPTAAGGTVFVTGAGIGGRVFAIAADSGRVRWTSNVWSGDSSSPAVVPEAIVTSSACEQVLAMAPDSGCLLWEYAGPCQGGGGGTAVIQGERVWAIGSTFPAYETTNEVLDRRTGAAIRLFETMRSPALDGDYGYFTNGHKLQKAAVDSGDVAWTFEGDDELRAPILANGHAYVISTTGMLTAVNLQTGAPVWSDKAAEWISSQSDTTAPVTFGLAAGEDHLIVPGPTTLVAYH